MPSTLFDVVFRPTADRNVRSFDQGEQDTLFKKPSVQERKPKVAGAVFKVTTEESDIGEDLSLQDLALGYTELEERLEKNLDVISSRAQGLTYNFDPFDFSDLAEAISAIFKGVSGYITFDMYRQALELDRDLAILIGEAEHGLA